jgi:hypothetical protein
MKQNTNIKTLIFAAAVSLGAVSVAPAQSAPAMAPAPSPAPTEPLGGLLGSRYTEIGYNYIDLTGPGPKDANGFAVAFNQPLRSNLDLTLDYDWARTHYAGDHFTQQDAEIGATAYSSLTWGRPFALAAVGWEWGRGGGISDDSFRYKLGVGTEIPVARPVVITPFVNFVRETGFNDNEVDFGVKAAYRVTKDWSVTARVQYDAVSHAKDAAEYMLGVAYHF